MIQRCEVFILEIIIFLKVDMIVNSVDKTLNLNKGSLSNGIATAAGQQIKDECQQNHPSGVTEGNIVVTSSGSLPCKKICHACVPGYKPNKDNESKKVNNMYTER